MTIARDTHWRWEEETERETDGVMGRVLQAERKDSPGDLAVLYHNESVGYAERQTGAAGIVFRCF